MFTINLQKEKKTYKNEAFFSTNIQSNHKKNVSSWSFVYITKNYEMCVSLTTGHLTVSSILTKH